MKNIEKLPNILIIGTHKSGTTSLFEYLNLHTSIFCPLVKEIHFFTDLIYQRPFSGIENYAKYYSDSTSFYNVDCSPSYYYADESIINEMKNILGGFKMILVLREPKARIISFYKNQIKRIKIPKNENLNEFLSKSVPQAEEYLITGKISDNPHNRAVRESLYGHYISKWYNQFNKEDIKILFFEDLISDTSNTLNSICNWLEIEQIYTDDLEYDHFNKAMEYKNRFIHKYSVKYFRKYENLVRKSGLKKTFSNIYNAINSKKISTDLSISEEINNKLNKLISHDKEILKTFLLEHINTPLPEWLNNE